MRDTTSAISSGPTSWRNSRRPGVAAGAAVPIVSSLAESSLRCCRARRVFCNRPRRRLRRRPVFREVRPRACCIPARPAGADCGFRRRCRLPVSRIPIARADWPACSRSSFISASISSRRSTACSSVSSASCRWASSSCISRRCTWSISVGTLSSSMASRLVASSIRSMALSGRKRSVM